MKTSRKLSRNLSDAGAISEIGVLLGQLENWYLEEKNSSVID